MNAERVASAIERASTLHKHRYDYSKVKYTRQQEHVLISCPEHGEFSQAWHSHLSGYGCPKCGRAQGVVGKRQQSKTWLRDEAKRFIKEARAVHGDAWGYDKVKFQPGVSPTRSKIDLICPEHGTFQKTWGNHVRLKQGCPKCSAAGRSARMSERKGITPAMRQADVMNVNQEFHGGRYKYPFLKKEVTHSVQTRITIECPEHGRFTQLLHNHLRGVGCKQCTKSSGEASLDAFVRQTLGKEITVEANTKRVIAPLEVDVFVPSLRVAFEYCGSYWHREDRLGPTYHADKRRKCEEVGVKLITIFDADWLDPERRRQAQNRIRNVLHAGGVKRVHGRKTEVREISSRLAAQFIREHHLRGTVAASVNLGLYQGDDLLSVMTFGKPRYAKGYQWELLRFCSASGINVAGGFSKLFSNFVKLHHPKSVVNYSDLRWGDGKVALSAGFVRQPKDSPPASWWVKDRGSRHDLLSRFQTQRSKLPKLLGDKFDPERSAAENLTRNGYRCVTDCGNAVYAWTA